MSVIADDVVRGTSTSPLRSGQTTMTTSEGTSRHAVVVTRAYEPHPAMINPLSFGHQQPQRTLYSQSPLNSQYDELSSEPNNQSDNIRPQCMLGKYQDQPRCVPPIVARCGGVYSSHLRLLRTIPKLSTAQPMLPGSCPIKTTPLSIDLSHRYVLDPSSVSTAFRCTIQGSYTFPSLAEHHTRIMSRSWFDTSCFTSPVEPLRVGPLMVASCTSRPLSSQPWKRDELIFFQMSH